MRRLIALLACFAFIGGACGDDDDSNAQQGSVRDNQPTVDYTVTATDYALDMPGEIKGGVVKVKFVNNGGHAHEVAFIEIGDKAPEQAIEDFRPVIAEEGSPIPAYLDVYGAIEAEPGKSATSTFELPEGRYVALCTFADEEEPVAANPDAHKPHFDRGMWKFVTVKGKTSRAMPEVDGRIVARDWSFDVPELTAGHKTLLFENQGPNEIHFAAISEYPEGMDVAAAQKAWDDMLAAGDGPPPAGAVEPEDVAFSGVFSPGGSSIMEVDLKAGRTYAVVCFISDRAGGPPHAIGHKMVKFFTVSG